MLITGNGKAGSWKIRGEQLGRAIGATVVPFGAKLPPGLVIVVKRTEPGLLAQLKRRPWVYDIVDAWPQPCQWGREQAVEWLRDYIARLNPTAVVFPTTQMLTDSEWRGPALVLPHHAWPKYTPREVQPVVTRVGYEGDHRYLGKWGEIVQAECAKRRWQFTVGDLSECDIGIALRDAGGYPAQAWKSNCKLANLQALGIPALCTPEAGYREFGSGKEWWIETPADLAQAFGLLAHVGPRARLRDAMIRSAPRLHETAITYRDWLAGL